MKTKYESADELADMFEEWWVPFKKWSLGRGESGLEVYGILDEKSKKIYLERYDSTLDVRTVYSFEDGSYPETWRMEEDGSRSVELVVS